MTISVFEEDGKFYPQVFLDDAYTCLKYTSRKATYKNARIRKN